ncbi:Ras-related rab-4, putative [Leishmania tarentolae]|uniref:Ras-related rab-4, putative n=1 Tax=Leishmania tarentolae TaxID=5689 RepID=A0A640KNS0_LEITA|nr:Ras-related rab-4, putative [Leishmania tarentolae]
MIYTSVPFFSTHFYFPCLFFSRAFPWRAIALKGNLLCCRQLVTLNLRSWQGILDTGVCFRCFILRKVVDRMSDKYHQLMKLIIIGDSGVGKSCLLHRFIEDTFSEEQTQTIGIEYGAKIIDFGGAKVKLQIWDTAGQERYKSVTRSYYRGATGCLIVYDVNSRSSYESVPQWLSDVRQLAGSDVVVMLIGNKIDRANGNSTRAVHHNEASLYAQQNGLLHFETSAATGQFVSEAFLRVAKSAVSLVSDAGPESDGQLNQDTTAKNSYLSSCSC